MSGGGIPTVDYAEHARLKKRVADLEERLDDLENHVLRIMESRERMSVVNSSRLRLRDYRVVVLTGKGEQ